MITCVPPQLVGVATARTLAADLAAITACPPDLVEYRADLTELVTTDTLAQDLCALRTATSRPLICTLRDVKEGGECCLPLEQRARFLRIALPLVDAVDIELANLLLLALLRDDLPAMPLPAFFPGTISRPRHRTRACMNCSPPPAPPTRPPTLSSN